MSASSTQPIDTSGHVRRVRRLADLSQRDLAAGLGIAQSGISRIESGRDLPVRDFERILAVAGLRLAVVDDSGREIVPMPADVFHDAAGRRQPAHLDVHARPEMPILRKLLRSADPVPSPSWHHRRPDRDRLRAQARESSQPSGAPEQLTRSAVAAARRDRRTGDIGRQPTSI